MNIEWGVITDRAAWFVVGLIAGFILGRWRNWSQRQKIKPQMRAANPHNYNRGRWNMRDERSAMSVNTANWLVMALLVVMVGFAAISADRATDAVARQQDERDREQACTTAVLFDTVDALNARTQFSSAQASANIALQRAQSTLINSFINPPPGQPSDVALRDYFDSLTTYLAAVTTTSNAQEENPYPTVESYTKCLQEARR